jgi:hypothetical protein
VDGPQFEDSDQFLADSPTSRRLGPFCRLGGILQNRRDLWIRERSLDMGRTSKTMRWGSERGEDLRRRAAPVSGV